MHGTKNYDNIFEDYFQLLILAFNFITSITFEFNIL